ncbi:uncharacterized protein BDZ99DRAFT_504169 [Mytilinidion resinicola]|uniref:WW domain-containing protein n=1 Tax=Mytilinidion resinicola TaxID=574789 RepID=A0A6A6Y323_9PEZI|nr:uncharacterized protein BDZ99DRAFT_504169 [Mytilinidion resinicola]KAF2802187.1 hypothetical protein BDZ99DRAFT_504169 [Mytilinidion resinicola]
MATSQGDQRSSRELESSSVHFSDDSMASSTDEGDDKNKRSSAREKFRRKCEATKNSTWDQTETAKWKLRRKTAPLCSACREIPFAECLSDSTGEGGTQVSNARKRKELVYIKSLSRILKYRDWCKLCRLLFRSICQPEYDLLKAEHISNGLHDNDKLKEIESFAEWTEKPAHWRAGADVWPFGYAVDRRQAAQSTQEKAKRLFSQAEERDLNFKSLNDIAEMYKTDSLSDRTVEVTNTAISIMNTAGTDNPQVREVLARAQAVTGHMALFNSKKRRRLPCILVIRAYRKDEEKAGVLSVRVYGHGRVPLAPLKEICHFSLRFETGSSPNLRNPRRVKEQIWYGNKLELRINVDFFAECANACMALHKECAKLQWSTSANSNARDRDGNASFRLIDVHNMRIIETDFEETIRPEPHRYHLDYVALSYTWGKKPLPKGWIQQTRASRQGGPPQTEYYNLETRQATLNRPEHDESQIPTRLTTDNERILLSENGLKGDGVYIPKTIDDAIKVVKEAGQHYLWVDSLCVIQEEHTSDNRANIARMGRIYNHALFTIVAGDSPHADAGIDGISRDRDTSEVIMEEKIVGNAQLFLPVGLKGLNFRPWEERAWCFQEKVMSRRLLVFATGYAVWHCRGGVWREDVNALDGDKSSVSFPWLRLTPIDPPDTTALARAGLEKRKEDGSVRLMRHPAMDQYINAVEDFSRRAIGESWKILDAFKGVQNILKGPELLHSPFRNGLPSNYLDIALLWQPKQPLRRRRDHVDEHGCVLHCPPSWTWAGWESSQECEYPKSEGGAVYYDKPFDVHFDDLGFVKRLKKLGEERIRPRNWTLYGVSAKSQELLDLGMFSLPGMGTKVFNDWESWEPEPATTALRFPVSELNDRHLVLQTEVATLLLGKECWRERTYRKLADFEYCRETFHETDPSNASSTEAHLSRIAPTESDVNTTISHEYWIKSSKENNMGIVKIDAGSYYQTSIDAAILSEAQYIGNEKNVDVLGYPFYNVMLFERKSGGILAERIGLGKIYKSAWKKSKPRNEIVVVE